MVIMDDVQLKVMGSLATNFSVRRNSSPKLKAMESSWTQMGTGPVKTSRLIGVVVAAIWFNQIS